MWSSKKLSFFNKEFIKLYYIPLKYQTFYLTLKSAKQNKQFLDITIEIFTKHKNFSFEFCVL